jgi:tetratricopeptide (TPR) repeat protein
MVYAEKGDYKTALLYCDTVFAINQRIFGKQHPVIADSYYSIGVLLILSGDKKKGIASLEKSNYSADKLIDLLNRQAINFSTVNKGEESISLFLIALEMLEKMDVAKTSATRVIAYQNLAMAYCYNGHKGKAMPLFEKALSLAKSIKNGDKYTGGIMKNIEDCKTR